MGPVASQEAIKELGTNGGGFFNANSSHPFENPTALSNLLELLAILVIPAGLTFTFGRMVGNKKQGYVILGAMLILFVLFLGACYAAEAAGNPLLSAQGVSQPSALEGKEVRFGIGQSSLFTVVTTAASCGAVNNMHDSLTPLGGLVPLLQIMLGEVVFASLGRALTGCSCSPFGVFIIGLMLEDPRIPVKKIESAEMKMAFSLPQTRISILMEVPSPLPMPIVLCCHPAPHGLSEIRTVFLSRRNNGSAFCGLNANNTFYNISLAVHAPGLFGVISPAPAIAQPAGNKNNNPQSSGLSRPQDLFPPSDGTSDRSP